LQTVPPKVVFMDNSITEGWMRNQSYFFKANRFISGQTRAEMLVRFQSDVIVLNTKTVVINAGEE